MSEGKPDVVKVRAALAPWYESILILVRGFVTTGAKAQGFVAAPLDFQEVEEGIEVEPTLSLSMESAQTLMDDLWQCGLRPTEGRGSAGAMAATEKHLEDMRRIAFDLLPDHLGLGGSGEEQ